MTMKFPFTEDTLGKKLEAGTGLSVYCLTCRRSAVLDFAALVKRLGPDHKSLLCVPVDGIAYRTVVRWRKSDRVGVEFKGTEPKPKFHYG
ncbi:MULTISPECIES: hypothetical protein [unclassified Mesorhizobium]|uniref:hypothetical protein n=2 Tax=unclassified Mesorhizobium TaxID=325217 RepID=UPI001FDF3BD8|nr:MULTISPECIES: hypothetical protein [unclassified Mesorhizobium]MDF3167704.1 hypothetical protein [Mesorhizobium sp. P16.1]MDF3180549.1 hypothetical protein [Mesorhizobium sp. P17.1]MDG4889119.1 hypothetical protein [Mesorhizobium sp. WSM4887]